MLIHYPLASRCQYELSDRKDQTDVNAIRIATIQRAANWRRPGKVRSL